MKVAIFDFDGTLFDSSGYWVGVIARFFARRRLVPPDNIIGIIKPLGIKDAAGMFVQEFKLEEDAAQVAQSWRNQMGDNYRNVIPLREFAREYIEKLRSQGVKVCMATAMERDFVMPALEREAVTELFDSIVTIADVNANKSSAKIFEFCAQKYGAKPCECMVYEDSPKAAEVCSKAGFKVTGVYDGVCEDDPELMKPFCNKYIYSFEELF